MTDAPEKFIVVPECSASNDSANPANVDKEPAACKANADKEDVPGEDAVISLKSSEEVFLR
ncbi:unnamed protein product [Cylicostephanus goldi]|uniref:Uncharacterized protein n=1 Tax=Cylicostephanus goldi TaxID=71465 RepID=A0A3P7NF82_CYLGO|nr:unnamed protein product [Cylicostephanus goldi]